MSQISLKEFTGQIRQRIDEERASEAIPMAQYLLRQYPRYLKGYELLAEAALQQGNIKDAIEVFRRVLSADPENLIAYRGMGAAYAQEEEISEALWYMMRAFERDPRVRGIRQELRDLYQQRDGRRPGRLNLNRAALARMYMREGLYNRAIEELSTELENGPHGPASDRVDLFMALAQAQWFANQRSDAVETAQKVRLELPYCLKANLILAEFYAPQGDLVSADIHLRIAQEMDPENDLAVELFGESGYLQPNQVMIESLEEAWKTGSDEEDKMPEWLADLSLFATAEAQDQEVDWDAIIAYETDWRTILAKTTHQAITNFVPNWRVDLRHATRLSLKEGQDEQAESPILDVSREQPLSPILELEKELLYPSLEAKEEPPSTLLPEVVASQLVTPDWRDALQEATWQGLKDASASQLSTAKDAATVQAKQEPPSKAIREEELALGRAWKEELRAETEPWLDKIEPSVEPEPIEPERSWISSLTAVTRAYLSAAEQAREAPESLPELIEGAGSSWVEALRQESEAALPSEELLTTPEVPERQPELVEPAKAAWVKALRQESEAALPSEELLTTPEVLVEPAKAAWVEALRQESEANDALPSEELLTTPEVPERLPELVEPAKAAWVEALRQESEANDALPSEELTATRLTEQLTEEVKASESVSPVALRLGKEWRAALRAETEELLAKRQEAPIETTVIPLPAEAAWASALREETQEQLEKLSLATSPWVISLRGATEEQLERLSAADTAWASSLRDDSQRQLEQLSAGTTAWAIALRRSTSEELSSLSAAETAWVKGLRHLTGQQLLTLSSAGSPWAKNLHQETKNLLRWIDEGKQGWISTLQDDSLYALNAYEEAHRPPDITAPVDPPQSDFIASLMAAAEKVTADEEPLSEVAEDFWDDIALEDSESQPELSFDRAEEGAIEEPIAPTIAPPVKEEPKAREERFAQPPSRSERVAKEESVPQKEAIIKPRAARPAPAKEPLIKERKADKVPVVEEKVSAVPDPSDEWRTARWLWETKQDKEALAIYQRIFDERQAPNEKLAEELSAWTKPGNASALAYQLLGDLYRRMGRMQDAVAQYREAINRM